MHIIINGPAKRKFLNLSIRRQLIYSFILVSILPFLIFTYISYNGVSDTMKKNSVAFIYETVNVLNRDITRKMTGYKDISSSIILDPDIYSIYLNDNADLDYYSRLDEISRKLDFIKVTSGNIRSICIYSKKLPVISTKTYEIYMDKNYMDSKTYKDMDMGVNDRTIVWSMQPLAGEDVNKGNYIYLQRAIPNQESINGVLQIQLFDDCVFNEYKDISFCEGSNIFIIDKDGNIISKQDKTMISAVDSSMLQNMNMYSGGSFQTKIDKKNYLVIYSTIKLTSWILISTIPMDFIESESNKNLSLSLLYFSICMVFIILLSILISSGIARPLKRVCNAMEHMEKGNFNKRLELESDNEIGRVCIQYNKMADEIVNLMGIIREDEKKKKAAYFKVLQAQIKPHFIYNTLFSIKCLASMNKQTQIEEMLNSFINLLMESINRDGEFITVVKETEYVKNYILIQSYRFDKPFNVIYDIDESIKDCLILKLLIQPLVENSLLHGASDDEGRELMINISGRIEEGKVVIRIADNGKGADVDKINSYLQQNKNSYNGIGISNTNERIKLNFGLDYGLEYSSVPGGGIEAVIRLPFIKNEEELSNYV